MAGGAVVTGSNLLVIGYVLLMALPRAKLANLRPFFPKGLHGTFSAASVVFFSYVGFDTIATIAEEVPLP
jgi:basic amino acid/polyamine antiporter, APA family